LEGAARAGGGVVCTVWWDRETNFVWWKFGKISTERGDC